MKNVIDGNTHDGRTIKIVKTERRGERAVIVAGLTWGHIEAKGRGCHGIIYRFYQVGGGIIHDRKSHGAAAGVWSNDKTRRMAALLNKPVPPPIEELLIAKVRELIKERQLLSPGELQVANDKAAADRQRRAAKDEARRKADFQTRARQALVEGNAAINDQLVERVVDAMEWAQQR